MSDEQEITPDGYIVIKERKPSQEIRGTQCGKCGMKFEYGKSYGYHCPASDCPVGWSIS